MVKLSFLCAFVDLAAKAKVMTSHKKKSTHTHNRALKASSDENWKTNVNRVFVANLIDGEKSLWEPIVSSERDD